MSVRDISSHSRVTDALSAGHRSGVGRLADILLTGLPGR